MIAFQGFIINGQGTVANGLSLGNTSNSSGPTSVQATGGTAGLGIFNCTGDALQLYNGAQGSFQSLFGNGNGGYGCQAHYGGRGFFSNQPTLTGTLGEVRFCGSGTVIPPLVAGQVVPAAVAFTTWAHLAGFTGKTVIAANGTCLQIV